MTRQICGLQRDSGETIETLPIQDVWKLRRKITGYRMATLNGPSRESVVPLDPSAYNLTMKSSLTIFALVIGSPDQGRATTRKKPWLCPESKFVTVVPPDGVVISPATCQFVSERCALFSNL